MEDNGKMDFNKLMEEAAKLKSCQPEMIQRKKRLDAIPVIVKNALLHNDKVNEKED